MRSRLRTSPTRPAEPPRLELMPLLDVVFLLLTFFAFAMLLMVRATVLDVSLPVIEQGQPSAPVGEPLVISLTADGELAIDAEPAELDQLIATLRSRQSEQDLRVLLEVDAAADSGELIRLVQRLRAEGITDFGVLGLEAEAD